MDLKIVCRANINFNFADGVDAGTRLIVRFWARGVYERVNKFMMVFVDVIHNEDKESKFIPQFTKTVTHETLHYLIHVLDGAESAHKGEEKIIKMITG